MSNVTYRQIDYNGLGSCMQISNGIVDVEVSLDFGPRIMRYSLTGGRNVFCEDSSLKIEKEEGVWQLRGGHRLWHSPEKFPRTYDADNYPVTWSVVPFGIRAKRPLEERVLIDKEMIITLSPDCCKVSVEHVLTNRNSWRVQLAAWGLSVMAAGGKAIVPVPQNESHFSEGAKGARNLTLWSYAKMNDPRVRWGARYIVLKQDPAANSAFKFGISNEDGWAAYVNGDLAFVKRYVHQMGATYPDGGVSCEVFTNDFMLELESLSPLRYLEPLEELRHLEEWDLKGAQSMPLDSEDEIEDWADRAMIPQT